MRYVIRKRLKDYPDDVPYVCGSYGWYSWAWLTMIIFHTDSDYYTWIEEIKEEK